jgi:hypothetical protein
MILYPDISNNNFSCHQDVIRFLSPLRDQGFAGVVHKTTQGSDFVDEYYITALEWCIANAFPIIGYHYIDLSDPMGQAQNWVNAKGTPNAMLDFEMGSGKLDNFWAVVDAFNRVGTNISLAYVPNWYLNSEDGGCGTLGHFAAAGINLVSSAYPEGYQQGLAADLYEACGGDSGEGWAPYNDAYPAAWQFTSAATVSGFQNVDVNAYRGVDVNVLFGIN